MSIALEVPVLSADRAELGTAREILCTSPHDDEPSHGAPPVVGSGDLWLRVERAAGPDLFIPFAEIVETGPERVILATREDEIPDRDWDRPPAGLPGSRVHAA